MNYLKVSAIALLLPASMLAQANPLTLGASVIYSQNPYKGGQERYYPFPIINYEGDRFFIRGIQAGYYLWNDEANQLSLSVLGSPQNFNTDDTDNKQLKQLSDRHMTLMGGVTYRHSAEWGIVRTVLVGDMLDNSNGFLWDLTYLYRFQFGDFTLTPGIGALWSSENQNDYYYGISKNESRRSGLSSYEPDASWNPYMELTATYALNANWTASASGRYTHLSDEVKDSPMVDRNSQVTVWTGISYTF